MYGIQVIHDHASAELTSIALDKVLKTMQSRIGNVFKGDVNITIIEKMLIADGFFIYTSSVTDKKSVTWDKEVAEYHEKESEKDSAK